MFKKLLRSKTVQRRTQLLLAVVMIPPFVFFFHLWAGNRQGAGPGGTAGEILGRPVSWDTFQEYHQLIRKSFEAQLGTIPEGLEPMLVQQTWDRLIVREEARRTIRLSDDELARHLRAQPTFQKDGRFLPELYYQYLRALGTTPQAFEARLRDELRIQKLLAQVKAEASVSEEDIRTAYAHDRDRLRAALVLITASDFEAQARRALTEQDLHTYLAGHEAQFNTTPERAIRYVGRSEAEARAQLAPITEHDIAQAYDERGEEFAATDGRIPPMAQVRDAIRRRLQEERAQKSLTELALDLQDDADAGLTLEAIAASRRVELRTLPSVTPGAHAIDGGPSADALAAAFEAPVGQRTRVIHTPEGVFVLEATHETPPHLPPFDALKDRLTAEVVAERARDAARTRATELRAQLLAKQTAGATFADAAASLGVTAKHPEPFARQEPVGGLGPVPQVTETLADLPIGKVSEVLDVPQGFVIAVVEERVPFDQAAFAKEHSSFQAGLLSRKQETRLGEWFDALRSRARLKSFLDQPAR